MMYLEDQPQEARKRVPVTHARRRRLEPAVYAVASFNAADPPSDREHVTRGTYATAADALNAAKRLIDEQLVGVIAAGCAPETALREWVEFGEIPVIVAMRTDANHVDFDPFSYAASRPDSLQDQKNRVSNDGRASNDGERLEETNTPVRDDRATATSDEQRDSSRTSDKIPSSK
jgi:hypothetical protein